jgi:hypothetical protein
LIWTALRGTLEVSRTQIKVIFILYRAGICIDFWGPEPVRIGEEFNIFETPEPGESGLIYVPFKGIVKQVVDEESGPWLLFVLIWVLLRWIVGLVTDGERFEFAKLFAVSGIQIIFILRRCIVEPVADVLSGELVKVSRIQIISIFKYRVPSRR